MAVDIEVNLDVDIEDGLARIKKELKSLDDEDFDLGEIFDSLDDVEIELDIDKEKLERLEGLEDIHINEHRDTSRRVNIDRDGLNRLEGAVDDLKELDVLNTIDLDEGKLEESALAEGLTGGRDEEILEQLEDIHRTLKASNVGAMAESIEIGSLGALDTMGDSDKVAQGDVEDLINKHVLRQVTPDIDADLDSTKISTRSGSLIDLPNIRAARNMRRVAGTSSELTSRAFDGREMSKMHLLIQQLNADMDDFRKSGAKVYSMLEKFRPTFARVYAVVATLLPAIAGLAAQAAALGVALGGLGAAGAGIMLLGALGGEADTLAGSVTNLEQRMKDFKQAFFQAIQPAADQYAPLFNQVLRRIVANASELTDELGNLTGFESLMFGAIEGGTNVFEAMIQDFNQLQPAIEAVASHFGSIIGARLPDFFRGVAEEGLRSYDTLLRVAGALYQVGRLVYNVLKAIVSFLGVLAAFQPVIRVIADLIGSRFFQGLVALFGTILTGIGILYGFATALQVLNSILIGTGGLMSWLASTAMAGFIKSIYSAISRIPALISQLIFANGVLATTAGLLSIVTAGLAAIAGTALAIGAMKEITGSVQAGPGNGNTPGTSTSGDVTMNIYGDPDEPTKQKMVDVAEGVSHRDGLSSGNFGSSISG